MPNYDYTNEGGARAIIEYIKSLPTGGGGSAFQELPSGDLNALEDGFYICTGTPNDYENNHSYGVNEFGNPDCYAGMVGNIVIVKTYDLGGATGTISSFYSPFGYVLVQDRIGETIGWGDYSYYKEHAGDIVNIQGNGIYHVKYCNDAPNKASECTVIAQNGIYFAIARGTTQGGVVPKSIDPSDSNIIPLMVQDRGVGAFIGIVMEAVSPVYSVAEPLAAPKSIAWVELVDANAFIGTLEPIFQMLQPTSIYRPGLAPQLPEDDGADKFLNGLGEWATVSIPDIPELEEISDEYIESLFE